MLLLYQVYRLYRHTQAQRQELLSVIREQYAILSSVPHEDFNHNTAICGGFVDRKDRQDKCLCYVDAIQKALIEHKKYL